ncbi:hypothetical protein KEM54_005905 [Ascosphaera aggregata]|nr:hypothetical protein KEM54_005905 [Ascosphaera aggregata]
MKFSHISLLTISILQAPASAKNVWKFPEKLPEQVRDVDADSNRVVVAPRGLDESSVSKEELPLIMLPNDGDQSDPSPSGYPNGDSNDIILPDVLGKERGLNIFASLTRYIDDVAARLSDPSLNTTVLAPMNSALQKLDHKPWEKDNDYQEYGEQAAYTGGEGEARAAKNLRDFVEGHVIPVSPWMAGEEVETLAGRKVTWEKKNGVIYIQPGDLKVERIATQTSNGEVWVLSDVISS